MEMGKKSKKSRRKAVKRLARKASRFFTAIYWLMGFILTAWQLWEKFKG
ncbi:MAG: hypothetical protein IJP86_09115 [Synergistaceae bacterium]|nr:hypothetical protein [Synergistaceae bacterium]